MSNKVTLTLSSPTFWVSRGSRLMLSGDAVPWVVASGAGTRTLTLRRTRLRQAWALLLAMAA